jgi:hypothetical protein
VADGRVAGILTRLAVGRTLHERAVAAAAGERPDDVDHGARDGDDGGVGPLPPGASH